jgi:hypothetical protein
LRLCGECGYKQITLHRFLNQTELRAMHDIDGPNVAAWVYESLLDKDILDLGDIPYKFDDAV